MGLIACPECSGKVSTKADACPHCGFRQHEIAPPPAEQSHTPTNYTGTSDKPRHKTARPPPPQARPPSGWKSLPSTTQFIIMAGTTLAILVVIGILLPRASQSEAPEKPRPDSKGERVGRHETSEERELLRIAAKIGKADLRLAEEVIRAHEKGVTWDRLDSIMELGAIDTQVAYRRWRSSVFNE
jgi:hypothetical protein